MLKTQPNACPHCGYVANRVENLTEGGAEPEPGDFTLCLNCGNTLVLTPGFGVRTASRSELRAFSRDDPGAFNEYKAVQQLIFDRGPFWFPPVVNRLPLGRLGPGFI